ncbi:MAG: GtrA family protein [Kiritimatiellales bacterium]
MKKKVTEFLANKDNPVVQFIKYGVCGGIATAVDIFIFFIAAWLIFPALTESDPFTALLRRAGFDIQQISEHLRLRNYWIDKIICFIFSNLTAYILNVLFVFKAGRHKRHHEFMLFYGVSLISFFTGTFVGDVLIRFFGLATTYSYVAAMISALLVNYAGRKFFVFKG